MATQVSKNGNGSSSTQSFSSVAPMNSKLLRVEFQVVGRTPILFNRIQPETLENLRTKTKASKNAPRGTPKEEAATKVYLNEKGNPIVPSEMFLACLIAGGQFVRLDAKRQISTAKSTILPAFVTLEDMSYEIIDPKTGKPAEWVPDTRAGRNPNGGELVAICRPRFDSWSFKGVLQIDTSEIGEDKIMELMEKAGMRCGLGDHRPARKGMNGQFAIKNWNHLKQVEIVEA